MMYPAQALSEVGVIERVTVRCVSAKYLVQSHTDYKLREKDYKDVSALCQKFGIPYPEEYAHLSKKLSPAKNNIT